MAKGKRDRRRALAAWTEYSLNGETDPDRCTCGHGGLAPSWHGSGCPIHDEAMAERMGIVRGV